MMTTINAKKLDKTRAEVHITDREAHTEVTYTIPVWRNFVTTTLPFLLGGILLLVTFLRLTDFNLPYIPIYGALTLLAIYTITTQLRDNPRDPHRIATLIYQQLDIHPSLTIVREQFDSTDTMNIHLPFLLKQLQSLDTDNYHRYQGRDYIACGYLLEPREDGTNHIAYLVSIETKNNTVSLGFSVVTEDELKYWSQDTRKRSHIKKCPDCATRSCRSCGATLSEKPVTYIG